MDIRLSSGRTDPVHRRRATLIPGPAEPAFLCLLLPPTRTHLLRHRPLTRPTLALKFLPLQGRQRHCREGALLSELKPRGAATAPAAAIRIAGVHELRSLTVLEARPRTAAAPRLRKASSAVADRQVLTGFTGETSAAMGRRMGRHQSSARLPRPRPDPRPARRAIPPGLTAPAAPWIHGVDGRPALTRQWQGLEAGQLTISRRAVQRLPAESGGPPRQLAAGVTAICLPGQLRRGWAPGGHAGGAPAPHARACRASRPGALRHRDLICQAEAEAFPQALPIPG